MIRPQLTQHPPFGPIANVEAQSISNRLEKRFMEAPYSLEEFVSFWAALT